ncbi:mutS protein homolog 4-like [Colletes gigas]|uniref:mutS protein homolog 4-like n=1 Tax=Colletes gigas TaxID=935657 RepID=UPI001C9A66EC|nr:mutS protein homolog 4-like [Colletes gigas]
MNVIRTEKVFQPPGGRNEPTTRDQFAVPSLAKRSGTKSTTDGNLSTTESGGIILAITTGRGEARAEVGLAALDIRCPYLILCQISDSQIYTNALSKLYLFDPIEVLMPDTMCERTTSRSVLYPSIKDKFPELQVTPISRVHFNDTVGLERVRTLCAAEYSSVELFVKQKYYALAAAAALLKYVEYAQRIVYTPKSMKIEFQGSPNATTVDLESARSLELVQSQSGQRNVSLLGILDNCSTPMGRKLLRANILQPPCEERLILERQSCIAELVSNRSMQALLQPIIRRLYGADRLLALSTTPILQENNVQCAEQNLNYLLLLKNLLNVVPELESTLAPAKSDLLQRIRKKLDDPRYQLMKERILETIHSDARSVSGYTSANMQRCFAIKAGINDLLDIARQTYCELIDDMKTMVENLTSKYHLPLSLGCNASLGYHVQAILPRNLDTERFIPPDEFIEVRRNRRVYTMTTTSLATLGQQCKIASEELHLMSNVLLCDLLQNLRQHVGCLFQLCTDVAELDLITSLARVSSIQTYTRPTFGPKLELLDSRHPVLEIFGLDGPIPNNVHASVPLNVHVISGPNMSGKSTYLKQIVLLHIMSQIGCFVPARKAVFRITDLIFCKIALRDDIECNASTFAIEMKEAQYILRSITPTSLVVLDELCKGTAIEEGASIAWAICERLLNTNAFIFAATHFVFLTKLADLYYNVTNHYFETINALGTTETDNCCRLTYTHRLKLGVAPTDDYGIVLAESSGLPKSVTEKARKYASEQLTVDRVRIETSTWEHACYKIVSEMYELLEIEKLDQTQVTRFVERIAKVQMQDGGKDTVKDNGTTNSKEIVAKKRNENEVPSVPTPVELNPRRSFEGTKQRTPDAPEICTDNNVTGAWTIATQTNVAIATHVTRSSSFEYQNNILSMSQQTQNKTIDFENVASVPRQTQNKTIDFENVASVSHQTQNKTVDLQNISIRPQPAQNRIFDFQNVPEPRQTQSKNVATASQPKEIRTVDFQNVPLNLGGSKRNASCYSFSSIPSLLFPSTATENASNKLEKHPSTSSNRSSYAEELCDDPDSICSKTNDTMQCTQFTDKTTSMRVLMSGEVSSLKLHEYYLSDDDLEPPDMSQVSIFSRVAVSNNTLHSEKSE